MQLYAAAGGIPQRITAAIVVTFNAAALTARWLRDRCGLFRFS